jgi:hypothetical protein
MALLRDIAFDGDFVVASATGDIALAAGADVVAQDVTSRLLTDKGTLVDAADYGFGLAAHLSMAPLSQAERAATEGALVSEVARDGRLMPETVACRITDTAEGRMVEIAAAIAPSDDVDPTGSATLRVRQLLAKGGA